MADEDLQKAWEAAVPQDGGGATVTELDDEGRKKLGIPTSTAQFVGQVTDPAELARARAQIQSGAGAPAGAAPAPIANEPAEDLSKAWEAATPASPAQPQKEGPLDLASVILRQTPLGVLEGPEGLSRLKAGLQGVTLQHAPQIAAATEAVKAGPQFGAVKNPDGTISIQSKSYEAALPKHQKEYEEAAKEHPLSEALGGLAVPIPGGEYAEFGRLAPLARVLGNAAVSAGTEALRGGEKNPLKAALLGGGLSAAGEIAAPLLEGMGQYFGRRALTGSTHSMNVKKEIAPEVVEEAVNSGILKPGGTTKGASARADKLRQELGQQKGDLVSQMMSLNPKLGVDSTAFGVHLHDLADQAEKIRDTARASLLRSEADELARIYPDKIPLDVAERIKTQYQTDAAKEYDKIKGMLSPAGEAKKALAGEMGGANAAEVEKNAAPGLAAQFKPLKERLGNVIEASDRLARGKARQADRSALGILGPLLEAGAGAALGAASDKEDRGTGALLGLLAAGAGHHLATSRGPSTGAVLGLKGAQALPTLTGPRATEALLQYLRSSGQPAAPVAPGAPKSGEGQ